MMLKHANNDGNNTKYGNLVGNGEEPYMIKDSTGNGAHTLETLHRESISKMWNAKPYFS